jgi:hypothetical protein
MCSRARFDRAADALAQVEHGGVCNSYQSMNISPSLKIKSDSQRFKRGDTGGQKLGASGAHVRGFAQCIVEYSPEGDQDWPTYHFDFCGLIDYDPRIGVKPVDSGYSNGDAATRFCLRHVYRGAVHCIFRGLACDNAHQLRRQQSIRSK